MKIELKKITALMLSLVMIMRCIPSFINKVDANEAKNFKTNEVFYATFDEALAHVDNDGIIYVYNEVVIDHDFSGDNGLSKNISIGTDNVPATILIKKPILLKSGEYSLTFVASCEADSLTIKPHQDFQSSSTRLFATRDGVISFNQNVILDGDCDNKQFGNSESFTEVGGLITVQEGGTLNIEGAEIKNFKTQSDAICYYGGAIVNNGTVNINDGIIDNCYASNGGGAIYNKVLGTVNINAGKIKNCSSLFGGAIFSYGKVNMAGGVISNCSSESMGGAIYNSNGSTFTMTGGTIDTADSYNGGAIYTISSSRLPSTVTISGGEIKNCVAKDFDDGQGKGGAIYAGSYTNVSLSGDLVINSCSGNKGGSVYLAILTALNLSNTVKFNSNVSNQQDKGYIHKDYPELMNFGIFLHDIGELEDPSHLPVVVYDGTIKTTKTKKYKASNTNDSAEKITGTGKKGSTRTITPVEGKKTLSVIVKDKDGNIIDVTANADGTYSFIQPASNVSIEVIYKNREITLNIGSTKADVDGERSNLDVCPVIRNDRTMLPIRFIAENLGAKVEWNEENPNYVVIAREDTKIEITLESDIMLVNGKEVKLDSVAFAENDRTYLPVRAISEALNAKVEWNENEPSVVKIYEQ